LDIIKTYYIQGRLHKQKGFCGCHGPYMFDKPKTDKINSGINGEFG